MYKLIDGKEISKSIRSELSNKISLLKKAVGLAVVLVGNNSASQVYVKKQDQSLRRGRDKIFRALSA